MSLADMVQFINITIFHIMYILIKESSLVPALD